MQQFNEYPLKKELEEWLHKNGIEIELDPLIIIAFTHPSYKGMNPDAQDYERLEFLGDSVLDLISAEELIRMTTSHESEGALTEKRKELVNNEFLARIFDKLKMEQFVLAANNYSFSLKDKANIVEALFGALFLLNGYTFCKKVWDIFQKKMGVNKKKKLALDLLEKNEQGMEVHKDYFQNLGIVAKNAKSVLQELCQKQGFEPPVYEVIEQSGPPHDPKFKVKVSCNVKVPPTLFPFKLTGIGEGKSKKLAEIRAAEDACAQINLPYIPHDSNKTSQYM